MSNAHTNFGAHDAASKALLWTIGCVPNARSWKIHRKTSRLSMNAISGESTSDRYSAKNMAKPVNFYCPAPTAQSVCLVGDFNGWNSLANPMSRQADGCWFTQVQLTHGHHRYCFLVDGEPTLDPRGTGITRNDRNERLSLIAVS